MGNTVITISIQVGTLFYSQVLILCLLDCKKKKKNENREILVDYIFEKVFTFKVWEDFLVCYTRSFYSRHEKTCLQGFRPGPTQIGLYNHKWLLDA